MSIKEPVNKTNGFDFTKIFHLFRVQKANISQKASVEGVEDYGNCTKVDEET